jgi:predicted RecB family nuclease
MRLYAAKTPTNLGQKGIPSKMPGMDYNTGMKITPELFGAFLFCPTKCWLKSNGEHGTGNAYAEWVESQNESFRVAGITRLHSENPEGDAAISPVSDSLKEATWRLATDVLVQTEQLESRIHALERLPSEGRGRPAQFIPIRFISRNKLTPNDKLLAAFDALTVSGAIGREAKLGKIIHGDDHATLKVKTPALADQVRKGIDKITVLLSAKAPPNLILIRHCPECEFRDRCRQKAIERDDLSLLSSLDERDRKKLNNNGIFTVTQFSYTFRPRRRPKRLTGKREPCHHSLRALAIRESKIYLVGSPEFKPAGTVVYLDVEGVPDRDLYYLIGARVRTPEGFVHHSFWADGAEAERTMWADFVRLLGNLDNPMLIHYGSYETMFFKRMRSRYGSPIDPPAIVKSIDGALNLLSIIYAQVYFPTFSNGLKEVAGFLGFKWLDEAASGLQSIVWRRTWEDSKDSAIKDRLVRYNVEDCEALQLTAETIARLKDKALHPEQSEAEKAEIVHVDLLKSPFASRWRKFSSPIAELEVVNKAASWDYQRERIYVRSSKGVTRSKQKSKAVPKGLWRVDKTIECGVSNMCPDCHKEGTKHGAVRSVTVQEILFGRSSLKRRVVRYLSQPYLCPKCRRVFGLDPRYGKRGTAKYGRSFLAYIFYQMIELRIPLRTVTLAVGRLFGLTLKPGLVSCFKEKLADYYSETQREILKRIVSGSLVHVDETHVTIKRRRAYVWVITNMREVVYIYSETREGEFLHELLGGFKGVLVSDFYAVYDSFDCPQQKCLIHLVRDLNEELLRNPYDSEFKQIVQKFGQVLKTIIDDVDRRGLKKHFLRKHLKSVNRFYRDVISLDYQSDAAVACKQRFEKNRGKLFTFLEFDGVPWNNNNAEHAIKAFARLRTFIESGTTEKDIKEYLVLLSVCQTCKYQGLDFLDFLRSGEKDIEIFAEKQGGKRNRSQSCKLTPEPFSQGGIPELKSIIGQ